MEATTETQRMGCTSACTAHGLVGWVARPAVRRAAESHAPKVVDRALLCHHMACLRECAPALIQATHMHEGSPHGLPSFPMIRPPSVHRHRYRGRTKKRKHMRATIAKLRAHHMHAPTLHRTQGKDYTDTASIRSITQNDYTPNSGSTAAPDYMHARTN